MKHLRKYLAGGGAVGIANGLFGGGGGMIAVPVLRAAGLNEKRAHATAIAVVLPASVLSGAVYCFGGLVPLAVLLPTLPGVVLGGLLGARLLGKLPARPVALLFALLMFAAGVRMLF